MSVYLNSFELQQVTFKISTHLSDTYRRKWLLCTLVAAVFKLEGIANDTVNFSPLVDGISSDCFLRSVN
jgi:hypothetical protein